MGKTELQFWFDNWVVEVDNNLKFKKAAETQINFVLTNICENLLKTHGFVVATHVAKSLNLPVYYIKMRNGIRIFMHNNFYGWKVSVEIPDEYDPLPVNYLPIDCLDQSDDYFDLFSTFFREGVSEEWCHDAYNPHQPTKKFTVEICYDEQLYVIIHYLKHAYPDIVFNVEDDKRAAPVLCRTVKKLFEDNGGRCIVEYNYDLPLPSWQVLQFTYKKLHSMFDNDNIIIHELPDGAGDESIVYAKAIIKYPEVHAEFLMEEWMYQNDFDS